MYWRASATLWTRSACLTVVMALSIAARLRDPGGAGRLSETSKENPHARSNHRIGAPGRPPVSAVSGVRQAGQRLGHGRVPGAVRRGGARLRGFLGAARAREPRLAQAVLEDARRIQGAVLQVVPRRRAERVVQLPRPAPE